MKNTASIAILVITLVAVFFQHIEWKSSENGTLLVIDNKEFDLLGSIDNQWNRFTRSCKTVTQLSPSQEKYQTAAEDWVLVEVEFTDLLPAVVLIQTKENQSFIVPNAVWSGYTKPWKSAPYIRKYISKNGNGMPSSLTDCFEPQSQSFQ
jgi:hypothetical protein